MNPNLKIAAVWLALGAGLVVVLCHVPMPGVESPPSAPPPSAAPPDSHPLEAGSAEEAYAKGLMALEQGRAEEAVRAFDRVLEMDPAHAAARVQKAFALARIEGTDPGVLRALLGGFDRKAGLANEEKAIARGSPAGPGRFHLERAVLLGFAEPPEPEAARKALDAAKAAGLDAPASLRAALGPPQVPPAPGR